MAPTYENLIKIVYSAFNARDIDTALSTMHSDVQWPEHLKVVKTHLYFARWLVTTYGY